MKKRLAWVWLLLLLPIASAGTDKEKKTYELIYQDVQLLKKQFLQLQEKIEKNAEDIKNIKEQTKELLVLAKLLQTEQAGLKADQAKIPYQYQVLLDKLETLNQQLVKVSEDLIEIKRLPTLLPQLLPQPQQPQPQPEEKKETKESEKKSPPLLQKNQGSEKRRTSSSPCSANSSDTVPAASHSSPLPAGSLQHGQLRLSQREL